MIGAASKQLVKLFLLIRAAVCSTSLGAVQRWIASCGPVLLLSWLVIAWRLSSRATVYFINLSVKTTSKNYRSPKHYTDQSLLQSLPNYLCLKIIYTGTRRELRKDSNSIQFAVEISHYSRTYARRLSRWTGDITGRYETTVWPVWPTTEEMNRLQRFIKKKQSLLQLLCFCCRTQGLQLWCFTRFVRHLQVERGIC